MKIYQHITLLCGLVLIALIAGFSACTTMHDPYEEFIKDGEIIYPGTPDSVTVYPGFNRIQLSWPLPADPTITKARIYWQNKQNSLEVSIDSVKVGDEAIVVLEDMDEGSYSFNIYHYDNEGNSSIEITVAGRVYGNTYTNSLLPRIINEAVFVDDTLRIDWGSGDETAFANEITYTSHSGNRRIYVPGDEELTMVADFDFTAGNTIQYRTMYRPDIMAVDTFYTASQTRRVYGPRVEYNKDGWIATGSSERGGTQGFASAIDNDPGTFWVNQTGIGLEFPHTIIVDMGTEHQVDGFTLTQRRNFSNTVESVEFLVSTDNSSWESLGIYFMSGSIQDFIDFEETHDFRYFKLICLTNANPNAPNVSLAEVGVYKR